MIVKVCDPKRRDSLQRLSDYLQRQGRDDVATLGNYMARDEQFTAVATNCGCRSDDVDTAIGVMRATQALNSRAKKKTMHLVVSFPKGERPAEEQLAIIETRLLESLGMESLQRLRVVHTDTDYLHMHIAVNRIHPETHRSIQPTGDHDSLSLCAQILEHELGLHKCVGRNPNRAAQLEAIARIQTQRDSIISAVQLSESWQELDESLRSHDISFASKRNGMVFVDLKSDAHGTLAASSIARDCSRQSLERRFGALDVFELEAGRSPQVHVSGFERTDADAPDITLSDEAIRMERHRGELSWQRQILDRRDELRTLMHEANSWQELHKTLAKENIALVRWRQGLVLRNPSGRGAIGASKIDRYLSMKRLENRLGEFVPGTDLEVDGSAIRSHNHLWDQYSVEKERVIERRNDEFQQSRAQSQAEYVDIDRKLNAQARSIKHNLFLNGAAKRRAFQRLKQRRKRARDRLRKVEVPRTDNIGSWRDWLMKRALEGHDDAIIQLQSISRRLGEEAPWREVTEGKLQGERTTGSEVNAKRVTRDGAHQFEVDGVALIDDGNALHCAGHDLESARALIVAATERFDPSTLTVSGDERLVNSVVIAAIDMNHVHFADPELEAQLSRLRTRSHDPVELEQEVLR